jgi:hypothetical protein
MPTKPTTKSAKAPAVKKPRATAHKKVAPAEAEVSARLPTLDYLKAKATAL